MEAYVFVYVRAGKAVKIAQALAKVKGVSTARVCWGRPDVIAFVEAADPKVLADLILAKIQGVDGVEATDTRIVVET